MLSDSHGKSYYIEQVLSRLNVRPRAVLFLGDGLRDLSVIQARWPDVLVWAVAGNCDASLVFPPDEPTERVLPIEGRTVLMMHGHTHGVRYGIEDAVRYAAELRADVLLFGHTHLPCERTLLAGTVVGRDAQGKDIVLSKPLIVANPGSIGQPRDGGTPSFGVLTIRDGAILFSHGRL